MSSFFPDIGTSSMIDRITFPPHGAFEVAKDKYTSDQTLHFNTQLPKGIDKLLSLLKAKNLRLIWLGAGRARSHLMVGIPTRSLFAVLLLRASPF
jgi:hypothetical protein